LVILTFYRLNSNWSGKTLHHDLSLNLNLSLNFLTFGSMKRLLLICFSIVALCSKAQNILPLATVHAHITTIHDIDSALNGTWDYIANDTTTFLCFNHHLLMKYKAKGDSVYWDKKDSLFRTKGKIDTVLYTAFRFEGDSYVHSEIVYTVTISHWSSYDTESIETDTRYFGTPLISKNVLTITDYNTQTHQDFTTTYYRLPDVTGEK
jgi:hypothetical protein